MSKVKDLEKRIKAIEILMTKESMAPWTEDRAEILHDLEVMRKDTILELDLAKEKEYLNKRNDIIKVLEEPVPSVKLPIFNNLESFKQPTMPTEEEIKCTEQTLKPKK